jgi:hypothetical protein
MNIIELKQQEIISNDLKLSKLYVQIQTILKELRTRELPDRIVESINKNIDELNSASLTGKDLQRLVKRKLIEILELLKKELKIVPKGDYQNIGIAIGTGAGVTFGLIINNLAIGICIGLLLGIAIGARMEKKALKEGRQLDFQ